MMKRILTIITVFALCVSCFTISTFALETQPSEFVINEYDYIHALQEASETELEEIGLSAEDVKLVSSKFVSGLESLAQMSDRSLKSFGYSAEEIDILRAFAAGKQLSDAELRAVAGECTGDFDFISCDKKGAQFAYWWVWDHAPIIQLQDAAAVRWIAFDSEGDDFDVTRYALDSTIEYYDGSAKLATRTGTEEPNLDFNTVNIQFDMNVNMGEHIYAYAKRGEIRISIRVQNGTNANINYIKIAGLYGHTLFGIGFPSLSAGSGNSLSLSFTGSTEIDNTAGRKAIYYAGGKHEYID